jgi:hypothetical protein
MRVLGAAVVVEGMVEKQKKHAGGGRTDSSSGRPVVA